MIFGERSAPDLRLCNNYLEGGVGKPEEGGGGWEHRGKSQPERGGLGVKCNTNREGWALLFHSFSQTGKVVEQL